MRNKQVVLGAVLSYGAIFFNIIAGLLYTPWMIRTVGNDQYALYTLAISVINIFLIDFGMGASVSRFLSNFYARSEYEKANRFLGIVYKAYAFISLGIALCLFVFYFLIDGIYLKLTADEVFVFKRLFIIVATYSVLCFPFTTLSGTLMANERFIAVKACSLGQKVLNVAFIVLALLLGGDVYSLVLVNALSNVLFMVVRYALVRKTTSSRASFSASDRHMMKELLGYSGWSTVMSLAQRCIFVIAPSVIAALIGSVEVTLFSLASSLEGYVYTFSDAINGMFMPRVARIFLNDDAGLKLTNLMSRVGKFHVCTIGLIYIGFLCFGRQFVYLWMGPGYEATYVCALLLIFPSLIDLPQQVARTALLAENYVKEQALVYLVMAVVNLVLFFILIPMFGVVGAAISVCVAYLVRTIMSNVLYHKKLPVALKAYFSEVYCRWIPVAVVAIAFGYCFSGTDLLDYGWGDLLVKICVLGALYCVLEFFVVLKKKERDDLKLFLKILR